MTRREKTIFLLQDRLFFRKRLSKSAKAYLCFDKQLERDVVVKFQRWDHPQSPDIMDTKPVLCDVVEGAGTEMSLHVPKLRTCQELNMLSELKGAPHIQQLIGCFCFEDYCVIMTEYVCENNSFLKFGYTTESDLVCRKIAKYMLQLVEAISFCHAKHILIRDVKLSNILWTDDHGGHLTLIDFDTATKLRELGHNGVVGTDGFQAPELLAHDEGNRMLPAPTYGCGVDVYGAGVVLGCLLFQAGEGETTKHLVRSWRHYASKRMRQHEPDDLLHCLFVTFYNMTRASPDERWTLKMAQKSFSTKF